MTEWGRVGWQSGTERNGMEQAGTDWNWKEIEVNWNGAERSVVEWNGMGRNRMERNGMGWSGMQWRRVERAELNGLGAW